MNRNENRFQSVLIPIAPEAVKYTTLNSGTIIYEHPGLNARALGPIPAGCTLWVCQNSLTSHPDEHRLGHVGVIYQGWKETKKVTIGTTIITSGAPVYF